jgi:hypothetical protein
MDSLITVCMRTMSLMNDTVMIFFFKTPLYVAAQFGRTYTVKILLQNGAIIHEKNVTLRENGRSHFLRY